MAISEQWAELLEPGLRSIFELQTEALAAQSLIPALFNVLDSTKAQEHFLGMGGFGDWAEYEGAIEYDNPEQLYKTTLTNVEYVRGFAVERALVDDDQYNVINARPRGLAIGAMRTREKHAASIFNNAFSTSYVGGDAKPLCESAGHPYSPSNTATQTNEGSSALSYDQVIDTRRLMREFEDDREELVTVNPRVILVPPELEKTAHEICATMQSGEPQKPGTADFVASLVGAKGITYVVWDYLTDANNWFLIDPDLARIHLVWLERTPVEFALDPSSDFNLQAKYRGYMRYAYGWSDWRFVYGHNVS